jgi:hypothetical protein
MNSEENKNTQKVRPIQIAITRVIVETVHL